MKNSAAEASVYLFTDFFLPQTTKHNYFQMENDAGGNLFLLILSFSLSTFTLSLLRLGDCTIAEDI